MRGGSVILPSERSVQRAILAMCGTCFRDVLIHHSPNGSKLAGSKRDRQVAGGILKGDGTKAGWPDLVFHWSPGKTAYIEVKRPKIGRRSDEQVKIHDHLQSLGIPVATVDNIDAAYRFLIDCGAPRSAELVAA